MGGLIRDESVGEAMNLEEMTIDQLREMIEAVQVRLEALEKIAGLRKAALDAVAAYGVAAGIDTLAVWRDLAPEGALAASVEVPVEDYPEWEQPRADKPHMVGDRVTHDGAVYESKIDYNVWSPAAYPMGWMKIA